MKSNINKSSQNEVLEALVRSWGCLGRVWGAPGEVLGVFWGASGRVSGSYGEHFGVKKSLQKWCHFLMRFVRSILRFLVDF